MRRLSSLLVLCLAFPAPAQTADAGVTGALTRPPTLVRQVEAAFPPDALDAGQAGKVGLELDLGADGKVTDARVVESAGASFDQAALEAVRQFEFTPAEVDGAPAAVRIQFTYEFTLRREVVEKAPGPEVVNFQGLLIERGTRNPVAHATVVLGDRETLSDAEGRFSFINAPAGEQKVVVLSSAHARYESTEALRDDARTEVTYYVRRKQYSSYESVVRGARERKEVSQVTLRQEEIRLIPGTQGDAFKVVQNLPGVARAPFSLGLIIVRGGKPWDTRVYVDDTAVPLLFHFGGLNATFNANLLEDISFRPGNFSTEYGRSIGGLVQGLTRTPSKEGVHGYVDVNVIDASAMLEAPLGEDWSVAAGVRRSYIDSVLPWVLDTFVPGSDALTFTVAPRYYDYQLKVERRPKGGKDRLSFTLFGSHDQLALALPNPTFDPEGRSEFETTLSYARLLVSYERKLSENARLVSRNSVGLDQSSFGAGPDLTFRSWLYPVLLRESVELTSSTWSLTFGADLFALPYRYVAQGPAPFRLNQIPDPFLSRRLQQETVDTYTLEPALFAEAVWRPWERLKLVAGLRGDYETKMRDGWLDPRVAAFVQLTESTALKGAAGLFHQPPDYRQGLLSEKFGNPDLLPEAASHYSVGVEHRFTQAVSLDVTLFYKDLFHQAQPTVAPAAGSDATAESVPLNYDSQGKGKSYGAELLLRHQLTERFFGWLSYSLSRAERKYPTTGEWGLHPFDQTHLVTAIASYKLPFDIIAGVRLRYATGSLDTPTEGALYDANGNYYYPLPGAPYSRRLPAFFQADVRVDKRFVFQRWMLSVYADVQNVTNRGNVEGVVNNFDYTEEQYLYGLPIIPAVGLRGEF